MIKERQRSGGGYLSGVEKLLAAGVSIQSSNATLVLGSEYGHNAVVKDTLREGKTSLLLASQPRTVDALHGWGWTWDDDVI